MWWKSGSDSSWQCQLHALCMNYESCKEGWDIAEYVITTEGSSDCGKFFFTCHWVNASLMNDEQSVRMEMHFKCMGHYLLQCFQVSHNTESQNKPLYVATCLYHAW